VLCGYLIIFCSLALSIWAGLIRVVTAEVALRHGSDVLFLCTFLLLFMALSVSSLLAP